MTSTTRKKLFNVLITTFCLLFLTTCAEKRVLLRTHEDIAKAYKAQKIEGIEQLQEAATSEDRNLSTMAIYYLGKFLTKIQEKKKEVQNHKVLLQEISSFLISLYDKEKANKNDFNKKNILLLSMGNFLSEEVKLHYLKIIKEEKEIDTTIYLMHKIGDLYPRYDLSELFFKNFRNECIKYLETDNAYVYNAALKCIYVISNKRKFLEITGKQLIQLHPNSKTLNEKDLYKKTLLLRSRERRISE